MTFETGKRSENLHLVLKERAFCCDCLHIDNTKRKYFIAFHGLYFLVKLMKFCLCVLFVYFFVSKL